MGKRFTIYYDEGLPDEVLAGELDEDGADLVFSTDGAEVFRVAKADVRAVDQRLLSRPPSDQTKGGPSGQPRSSD